MVRVYGPPVEKGASDGRGPGRLAPVARGELSKSAILSIALLLVDEHGLDGVTMRRIAEEAGLTPMSLYRHVRTKEEILDGLQDRVWEILACDPGADLPWRDVLFETFKHIHRVLLLHPGAIDVLLLKPSDSMAAYRWLDRLIGALGEAGFTKEGAMLAVVSLESYTLGFAIQQRVRIGRDSVADHPSILELPEAEFPNLAGTGTTLLDWASDEWFAAGLQRQIDSLERDLLTSS
jgi:AcrR family transcriptional regulator